MRKIFLSVALATAVFGADVVIKKAGERSADNDLCVQKSFSTEILSVKTRGI